ncbi:MAG TPA: hypothetical protein VLJ57_09365 [Burkholderiaceae bacterium]|nr:hypothetical protein [Burkholderiaceae bacterium]
MVGDELPHVVGAQFTNDNWPTCELRQQQPLDDAQSTTARLGRQAPCVSHVGVVAVELFGDRACRCGRPHDDLCGAQDLQHRHQRHVHLAGRAQRPTMAVAARQVVVVALRIASVDAACRPTSTENFS